MTCRVCSAIWRKSAVRQWHGWLRPLPPLRSQMNCWTQTRQRVASASQRTISTGIMPACHSPDAWEGAYGFQPWEFRHTLDGNAFLTAVRHRAILLLCGKEVHRMTKRPAEDEAIVKTTMRLPQSLLNAAKHR